MNKLTLLFTLAFSSITHAWTIDGLGDYQFDQLGANSYIMHGPLGEPNVANQGFMNNPGMIIGADGVIVIDPGGTYQIGLEVIKEIKKITDKPIVAAFNTHVHGDHWLGNQAIMEQYPNAKIYAHPAMIAQAKDGEGDLWVGVMDRSTEGLSKGTIATYPTDATSDQQIIQVGGETFKIHNDVTGVAHTDNDIMVEHVGSKTLFLGDNGLVDRFGRFDDTSNMHGNIKALEYAIDLRLDHYVPGHGPSGDADAAVVPFLTYLKVIKIEVEKGYKEDLADYEIKPFADKHLADYHDWHGYDAQLGKNINKMLLEVETLDL
ncbi:MBL-fold metallo-hydrolase superfamily [uncultured Gammaproteobacteria bacterium]|uniref:MBL fold metallo-hydrolase n=1 Tax=Bathymodiolus heckerae thiotrophic gill symbiont TaxID=1052212 RepID=UPI0010B878D9|nr:MBL fold metallo-hydrolase [Bathymodiolus heckerae thiotrophic gill symbiont]CAC9587195.1 MBL-fold metallo-hydrolase superfamily [uncultured Gammaproteobacteria bacterium]CAC9591940.1 MBL-fold metallo-hydrolase superfamily [uncultured Gammaproteobacteria bacterium]CAC9602316.1 MBL-fold metallo-hydrolase superfamily [uncultured Gammaproteobacteria bacterium]CAC9961025.1 MBL-fold metallo-hydrolase superfamily [uncultured Gammaproteobacteria bacterium]SHN91786.1 SoxH protein, homolog [Bathymod